MKPISLTLRGFIGIKKGMGLDEVTIDFSAMSGLIAFDGQNGSGKTTALDNTTPYRRLASREGSLAHHVFLRDSFRDFTFLIGPDIYRILIKIDAHNGKQEGFIWKNDEPQVSGKATEYDKYIEDLLGSPKLFFQSIFAAQGGGSLADMTTGELKGLFSEFLQLDVLAAHEETAKQAGKKITRQIETLSTKAEALREKADKADQINADLEAARQKVTDLNYDIETRRRCLETAEKILQDARDSATKAETAMEKLRDLRQRKTKLEDQKQGVLAAMRTAKEKYESDRGDIDARIVLLEHKKADSSREELQASYDEATKMIDRLTTETKVAQNEAKATRDDIESRRRKQQEYETTTREEIDRLEKELTEKREEHAAKKSEFQKAETEHLSLRPDKQTRLLEQEVESLNRQAKNLDIRDEDCKSETCVFIREAVEAKKTLPNKEDELADRRKKVEKRTGELEREMGKLNAELTAISEDGKALGEKLKALKQSVADEKERIDSFIADLLRSAGEAERFEEKATADIERITQERDTLSRQLADLPSIDAIDAEIKAAKENIDRQWQDWLSLEAGYVQQVGSLVNEIDALAADMGPLEDEAAQAPRPEAIEEKAKARDSAAETLKNSEKYLAQVNSEIAVLEYQLKEIATAKDDLAAIEQQQSDLRTELSEWQYIQNACGKNGLQALEIDGTAPLIAGYANELLTETFGPGATVGFRTINDDGKECLDIVVYREDDTDDNGTLLENLSGGQKVWILKSLRLALTLVSKAKSGKDIAAALSDEEDGALDADAAQNFINLYRAFLEAGGFESCIYITHRDEAKALADHVVKFGKGGVKVESGYSEAA